MILIGVFDSVLILEHVLIQLFLPQIYVRWYGGAINQEAAASQAGAGRERTHGRQEYQQLQTYYRRPESIVQYGTVNVMFEL